LILHLRHNNLHLDNLVATHTFTRCAGDPLLAHAQLLPGLCPWRNLQLCMSRAGVVAVNCRYLDLRSQRRFHHCHRHLHVDIVAHPLEQFVRSNLDNQVKIAGRSALGARIPFARQANPLTVARPGLNAKLQRLFARQYTGAIACGTRVLHFARTAAARALDVELHPPTHLRYLPRPMTLRALHASADHRTSFARGALFLALNLQPRHAAANRRPEIHLYLVLEIGAWLRPSRLAAASAKHAAENVFEAAAKTRAFLLRRASSAAALKAGKIKASKIKWDFLPATTCALSSRKTTAGVPSTCSRLGRRGIDVVRVEAELVVDLPLLVVAQNIVGFRNLFELLFRLLVPGIHIRMMLAREFAKRLSNLVRGRRLLHTQRAVIIFFFGRCHKNSFSGHFQ